MRISDAGLSFDTATSLGFLLVWLPLELAAAAATRDLTAERFDSRVAVLAGDAPGTAMSAIMLCRAVCLSACLLELDLSCRAVDFGELECVPEAGINIEHVSGT